MSEFGNFTDEKKDPENGKSYAKRLYKAETSEKKKSFKGKTLEYFTIQENDDEKDVEQQKQRNNIDKMNMFKVILDAEKVSENDALFSEGKNYYNKKDFDNSIGCFLKYIESLELSTESEEKKVIGQVYLALSYIELKKWDSCLGCLDEITNNLLEISLESEENISTYVKYYDLLATLILNLGVALCKNGETEQGLKLLKCAFFMRPFSDIGYWASNYYYFYSEKNEDDAAVFMYMWIFHKESGTEIRTIRLMDDFYHADIINTTISRYTEEILHLIPETTLWRECMGNLFFLFESLPAAADLFCDLVSPKEITLKMFKKAFNYALSINRNFLLINGIDSETADKVANGYLDLAFFYGEKLKETDDYPEICLKYETALLSHFFKNVNKAEIFKDRLSLKMPEYDKNIQDKAILAEAYRVLAITNYVAREKKNTKEYANKALILYKGLEPQSDYYQDIARIYLCLGWTIADEEPVQAEHYYREALLLLDLKDGKQGTDEEVVISWIISELEEIYEILGCKSLKDYYKDKQKESSYYYSGEYAHDLLRKAIQLEDEDIISNKQKIKDTLLELIEIDYHIGVEKLSEKEVMGLSVAYDILLGMVAADGDNEEVNRIADEAMAHFKDIDFQSKIYFFKGFALCRMNDYSGARKWLRKAIEIVGISECSNSKKYFECYRCNRLLSAMDAKEEKYEDALRSETEAIRNYELYIHEIDKEDTEHVSNLLKEVSIAVDILKKIDANDSRMEEFLNKKNKLMADLKVLDSDNT